MDQTSGSEVPSLVRWTRSGGSGRGGAGGAPDVVDRGQTHGSASGVRGGCGAGLGASRFGVLD